MRRALSLLPLSLLLLFSVLTQGLSNSFLSNAVNYSLHDAGNDFSWRFPIAVQFIFGAGVFVGTVFAPESPRYFVQRGNITQARANLAKLRGLEQEDPALLAELDQIVAGVEDEKLAADSTYLDCFRAKDKMLLRTMNGILIQMGQQWTGVNFFFRCVRVDLLKLDFWV